MIILISGPIGAGKSTIARQLAKSLDNSVVIDIEHVNCMFAQRPHGNTGQIEPKWLNFDSWHQSGEAIGVLARHFAGKECNMIIQGHVNELLLNGIDDYAQITHKILLLPSVETATERDQNRSSTIGHKAVQQHYEFFIESLFDSFSKIDSSNQKATETVAKIRNLL
jgi:hypothetical protein